MIDHNGYKFWIQVWSLRILKVWLISDRSWKSQLFYYYKHWKIRVVLINQFHKLNIMTELFQHCYMHINATTYLRKTPCKNKQFVSGQTCFCPLHNMKYCTKLKFRHHYMIICIQTIRYNVTSMLCLKIPLYSYVFV